MQSLLNRCLFPLAILVIAPGLEGLLAPGFIPMRPTWLPWLYALVALLLVVGAIWASIRIYGSEDFVSSVPTGLLRAAPLVFGALLVPLISMYGIDSILVVLSKATASSPIQTIEKVVDTYKNSRPTNRGCRTHAVISLQSGEADLCIDRIANGPLFIGEHVRVVHANSFFGIHVISIAKQEAMGSGL